MAVVAEGVAEEVGGATDGAAAPGDSTAALGNVLQRLTTQSSYAGSEGMKQSG